MSRYTVVPLFRPADDFWGMPPHFGPGRIFDQYFGAALTADDILPTSSVFNYYARPRRHLDRQTRGSSEIATDHNKFQVMLDVNQFSPDEINVKTVDNCVVVDGKHEEKLDEHGYVARQFQRRYILPDNVVPETVLSSLSHDGILTVEAPRKALEAKVNERIVPITRKESRQQSVQVEEKST